MTTHQETVLHAIRMERGAQDAKWGEQNHPDHYWMTILTEEVGELAHALLHEDRDAAMVELAQVGAVAVAWMEALYRRGRK